MNACFYSEVNLYPIYAMSPFKKIILQFSPLDFQHFLHKWLKSWQLRPPLSPKKKWSKRSKSSTHISNGQPPETMNSSFDPAGDSRKNLSMATEACSGCWTKTGTWTFFLTSTMPSCPLNSRPAQFKAMQADLQLDPYPHLQLQLYLMTPMNLKHP